MSRNWNPISAVLFRCRGLYYAFRLMFSSYFIGGAALAIALAVVTVQIENWHFAKASFETVQLMFIVVMPLVTIIFTANAFAEDFDERVFPLVWTYPVRKWTVFMERTAALWLILVIFFSTHIAAVHVGLMELTRSQVWDLLKLSLPTHLFLSGGTLLFSLLGRSLLAGIAAGGGYWLMEMTTLGQWTKGMYLFEPVWTLGIVEHDVNRWGLFGLGLFWFVLSLVLFIFAKRWIARK